MEVREVKDKLVENNLCIDKQKLQALFRKTAGHRQKADNRDWLSFNEFMIFAKSEPSSKAFQQMIKETKAKILRGVIHHRRVTSIPLKKIDSESEKILPSRNTQYIMNLPTTFNTLMSHLDEEANRNKIRLDIDLARKIIMDTEEQQRKRFGMANENVGKLKDLISSHFGMLKAGDDEIGRMIKKRRERSRAESCRKFNSVSTKNRDSITNFQESEGDWPCDPKSIIEHAKIGQ